MKRFLFPMLAALLPSVIAAPALAWGVQGHGLVAEVAQGRLEPAVALQIDQLLAIEGHDQLVDIASWADQLRERDPDLGRRSARWHFINLADEDVPAADNCHYQPQRHCKDGNCVIAAIDTQAKRLGDTALAPLERLQALKFVVHFVGDVHQPMHAGYGHDKGGNDMQVQHDGRGSNLHSLWDSGMLRTRGWDNPAYLSHLLALEQPELTPARPDRWAENSCRIAIADGVYPDSRHIRPAYLEQHLPTAEAQLRLAGEHLADLLNRVLASGN